MISQYYEIKIVLKNSARHVLKSSRSHLLSKVSIPVTTDIIFPGSINNQQLLSENAFIVFVSATDHFCHHKEVRLPSLHILIQRTINCSRYCSISTNYQCNMIKHLIKGGFWVGLAYS